MARSSLKILGRAAFLILIAIVALSGQSDLDAVRPFVGLGGPGGRAGGLGQAYTGVADDVTALYYNPAGLAHLTRREINLGLTYLYVATDVSVQGTSNSATITATRLSNAGLALPIPGSKLSVAFGYHQVRAFERWRVRTLSYGTTSTIKEELTEEGSLGAWSLGIGYQVSPQLAVGAAIDILTGENVYTWDSTFATGGEVDSSDYLLIEPEYTGVGLSLGLLLTPLPPWRIGLLLRSPQWISVSETSSDSYIGGEEDRDYKIRSSYYLRLGSSLTVGPVLISGDLFWFDYSQIRFESDLMDIIDSVEVPIDVSINGDLRDQYAPALGYAAGMELLLPGINAKLRAGYRNDPPINRNSPANMTQHTLALGLSIVPVPQIRIDATYSFTHWERDYSPEEHEETSTGNAMVNFVYRF